MADEIIIISGKQFCGKDTIAKLIMEKKRNFRRIGLADAIKKIYSQESGISIEEIEKNKSEYRADLIALGNKGREADEDKWIKVILAERGSIIVPDVRMRHEIEKFKEQEAYCIRVEADATQRGKRGKLSREDDYTETALDDYKGWDYIIENGGTKEELQGKVDKLIEAIEKHFNDIDKRRKNDVKC